MSLVEALDKGCVPLLGTARFLFCGSWSLRARFFGPFMPCRVPRSAAPVSPVPFARPFAFLLRTRCCPFAHPLPSSHPFAKINNTPAVQSVMRGVQ